MKHYKSLMALLSGLFFCPLVAASETTNTQAVKLFTSPWSRLFSGDENTFSTALTYSSPLKKKMINVPTGKYTSEEIYKVNQRGLFSMQYSPISYLFANMTVEFHYKTPVNTVPTLFIVLVMTIGIRILLAWFMVITTIITVFSLGQEPKEHDSNKALGRWATNLTYPNRSSLHYW